jgi:hypothetical protein
VLILLLKVLYESRGKILGVLLPEELYDLHVSLLHHNSALKLL